MKNATYRIKKNCPSDYWRYTVQRKVWWGWKTCGHTDYLHSAEDTIRTHCEGPHTRYFDYQGKELKRER